jgi:hypothetical protein
LIDYHLVYIVVVIALAVYAAGDTWGFGRRWAELDLVQRDRWLRGQSTEDDPACGLQGPHAGIVDACPRRHRSPTTSSIRSERHDLA